MKVLRLLHIKSKGVVLPEEARRIFEESGNLVSTNLILDGDYTFANELINKHDLVLVSLNRSHLPNGKAIIKKIIAKETARPLLVFADCLTPAQTSELLTIGADDFIVFPFNETSLLSKINTLIEVSKSKRSLFHRTKELLGLRKIIGKSKSFIYEIEKIPVFAKCDCCVLVIGETGTGKEMIARSIHYLSHKANKPFVPINCGAIPSELVENELFGHEKGAFTGAMSFQKGLIQAADQGTLFLDEVDSLPLFSQVKLLRFLQEKEFRPLGSTKTQKADVRIIAASNENLEEQIETGKLRMDLYYRLNVLQVVLPPLRNRLDDIPLLAQHFVEKYAVEFDKDVYSIDEPAIQRLQSHTWRGNVRELENVIERAVLLTKNSVITDSDINFGGSKREKFQENFQSAKARVVAAFEKSYLQKMLSMYKGNISQAAKAAGKNRRAFFELIRKYDLRAENFRLEE